MSNSEFQFEGFAGSIQLRQLGYIFGAWSVGCGKLGESVGRTAENDSFTSLDSGVKGKIRGDVMGKPTTKIARYLLRIRDVGRFVRFLNHLAALLAKFVYHLSPYSIQLRRLGCIAFGPL